MCWTLCYNKSICPKHLRISEDDAFKVWCIFNFLSEDKYPLVIITEEVRKILAALFSRVICLRINIHTYLSISLDWVPPAKADGGHGERVEWGEIGRLQAAVELKEELPDCLGADWTDRDGLLQQESEPSHLVPRHQWGLPGTHTRCAQAGCDMMFTSFAHPHFVSFTLLNWAVYSYWSTDN